MSGCSIVEVAGGSGHEWQALSQLDRGARDPQLLGAVTNPREAISQLDVALVGTGSVGMAMVRNAAQWGVRSLLLVDRGTLKPESFLTHPCQPADLGRPKAVVAGELAKALSPNTRVRVLHGGFDEVPSDLLADASVLLLASDNLQCEARVGERASELGVPLLQGSVHGATLTAEARVFANQPGGPCPACGFLKAEWEAYDRGTLFSCAGDADSPAGTVAPSTIPTASPPQLCSLAADLVFLELTRRLAGIAAPDESRVVQYNGFAQRASVTPLERSPACPIPHEAVQLVGCGSRLPDLTPRELLECAGFAGDDPRRVTLAVEGHQHAGFASCECSAHPELARFYVEGQTPGHCPKCDSPRALHPLHTRTEIPVSLLAGQFHLPLAALGANGARAVRLRSERGSLLFHRGARVRRAHANGERP